MWLAYYQRLKHRSSWEIQNGAQRVPWRLKGKCRPWRRSKLGLRCLASDPLVSEPQWPSAGGLSHSGCDRPVGNGTGSGLGIVHCHRHVAGYGVLFFLCKLINWHDVLSRPTTVMPLFIAIVCVLFPLPGFENLWPPPIGSKGHFFLDDSAWTRSKTFVE